MICQNIANCAGQHGLLVNMKKTQFMSFNIKNHTNTLPPLTPVNNLNPPKLMLYLVLSII